MNQRQFRVYDKENQRMLYSHEPQEQGERAYIPVEFGIGFSGWDMSWLSDTMERVYDLYDRLGHPVYEGDIVKAVLIDDNKTIKKVIEEVKIHQGHLSPFYMRINFEEDWWKDSLQDGFEVVGNIHENADLLK